MVLVGCSFGSKDKDSSTKRQLTADVIEVPDLPYTGEATTHAQAQKSIWIYYDEQTTNILSYTLTYTNNTDIGVATITITAKEDNRYYYGSVDVNFNIVYPRRQADVTTYDDMVQALSSQDNDEIRVVGNVEIPEGTTIDVPANKSFGVGSKGDLTNKGTINAPARSRFIVSGSSNIGSSRLTNEGTINVSGEYYQSGLTKVFNTGALNLLEGSTYKFYGEMYTNRDIPEFNQEPGTLYLRKQITAQDVELGLDAQNSIVYSQGKGGKPTVTIDKGKESIGIQYINADHVGQAQVKITASNDNKNYYGSLTLDYTIVKGECSFKTFDELKELQATGDYCKYVGTKGTGSRINTITIDSNFTIASDEQVIVQGLTLNTSIVLTNNGILKTSDEVNINGTLNNNNVFAEDNEPQKIRIRLCGTLNNGALATIVYDSIYLQNTTSIFENSGNAAFAADENTIYSSGAINVNAGGTLALGNATFGTTSTFNNAGSSSFNGDTVVRCDEFSNSGQILNLARVSFADDMETYSNTGTWNNYGGKVWAFSYMVGIDHENTIVRTYLTNHTVELLQDAFDYDTTVHKPGFTVDGVSEDVSNYQLSYKKDDQTVSNCKDSGNVNMQINASSYFYKYAGSVTRMYVINLGTATVTTNEEFTKAINDKNYATINLARSVIFSATDPCSISSFQTVNTNGYYLNIPANTSYATIANLTNYGIINVASIDTYSSEQYSYGLYVAANTNYNYYASFTNATGGVINNNGKIYFGEKKTIVNNYGTINNAVGALLLASDVNTLSGNINNDGEFYVRKKLSASNVSLNSDSERINGIDYNDGTAIEPVVKAVYDSSTTFLSTSQDFLDRLSITYEDNINASNAAKAIVTFKGDAKFDHYFYTSTYTVYFKINRIEKVLLLGSSIETSTFDAVNYYKYTLDGNVYTKSSVTNIRIPSDIILDMGTYEINKSGTPTITVADNVEIWKTVSSYTGLNNYKYFATKIKLSNSFSSTDIGTGSTFTYSTKDAATSTINNITINNGNNRYALEIDMNGKSLGCKMSLAHNYEYSINRDVNFKIINTASTASSIYTTPSSYNDYGLTVWNKSTTYSSKAMYVDIDNITINGGLYVPEDNYHQIVITAKDCSFISAEITTQTAYYTGFRSNAVDDAEGTFTNCTFRGANAAYICGGDWTFNGCSFASTGAYMTNGSNSYYLLGGNGITLEEGYNSRIDVTITGTTQITSTNGHGIVRRWYPGTASTCYIYLTTTGANITYTIPSGKSQIEDINTPQNA